MKFSLSLKGIPVGLYLSHTVEGCHFVASDCKANIIVVDSDQQMSKILSVSKGDVCVGGGGGGGGGGVGRGTAILLYMYVA